MRFKIKKDWAHSLAPNLLFKQGEVVEMSAADAHAGIEGGYVCDPNEPEIKAPIKKVEKAVSKKGREKR
jgi:hypothetical protein